MNTFYILRKQLGVEGAKTAIRKLRLILNVVDSSEKTVDLALNSSFSDFEDAIQYYTALNNGIPAIVTRNIKDYKESAVVIQSPELFLAGTGLLR